MCFSATASFSTSGILLLTGVASLSKTTAPSQRMLASIPLLFSIQQFSEGLLWMSQENPEFLMTQKIATYVFVIIGQSLWPVWIPMADLCLERNKIRRKILTGMVVMGIGISIYLLFHTAINKIDAIVIDHHIHYRFDYPQLIERFSFIYLIPTVFAHFVSSVRKINVLGFFTILAYIISKTYFQYFVFSVWCFFAAALSFYIYLIINSLKDEAR